MIEPTMISKIATSVPEKKAAEEVAKGVRLIISSDSRDGEGVLLLESIYDGLYRGKKPPKINYLA